MTTLWIFALAAVVVLMVASACVALANRRSDEPEAEEPTEPCTHTDPRCIDTAERLEEAKRAMRARGVRLLLEDRAPWTRVTGAQIVTFRRG